MDDTAFFYSRTLRIIIALAIILPLLGIGALVWYFASDVPEDTSQEETEVFSNGGEASTDELTFGDKTTP